MKKLLFVTLLILGLNTYAQNIFISTGSGTLYKTNPNTCTSTYIGTCPTFVDIAFLPNGKLYGQTWSAIYEVDTNTAATTLVMNVSSGNSLAGGSNGKLYAVSGTTLREIDPSVPSSTVLGTVNCGSGGDLAFFDDTLYLACSGNNLLKIDINNPGASYSVGNMSISGSAWGLINASAGCTDNPYVISSSGNMYTLNYLNATVGAPCNISITGTVYGAASPYEFGGGSNTFLGQDTTLCNTPSYTLYAPSSPNHVYLWSDNSVADTLLVTTNGTYWVEVTDTTNGCIRQDTVTVNFVNTNLNDTTIDICQIGNDDLNNYVTIPPGANWFDASFSPVAFPYSFNSTGTYTFYYAITGTCADTAEVSVNVLYDSIHIGNDTIFCAGGIASYGVNLPGFSFLWSTGATSAYINVTNSGTYYLDATSVANGCVLSDTVEVLVLPVPDAGIDGITNQCDFTGVNLFNHIQGTPDNGGTWRDPDGATITMPFTTDSPIDGNYLYIVTNGVCYDTSIVTLTNIIPDLTGFDYNPKRIIVGQTEVEFNRLSSADQSLWLIDGMTGDNLATTTRVFDEAKIYEACIILTNDNCIDTVCQDIEVIEDVNIFVPNSFTPDNDGFNDVFAPIITGNIEDYKFYVFNRWGEQLFFSEEIDAFWTGKEDGITLKNDTYVYRITYKIPGSVEKLSKVGHVTLVK